LSNIDIFSRFLFFSGGSAYNQIAVLQLYSILGLAFARRRYKERDRMFQRTRDYAKDYERIGSTVHIKENDIDLRGAACAEPAQGCLCALFVCGAVLFFQ
jgi:hypothetical protein